MKLNEQVEPEEHGTETCGVGRPTAPGWCASMAERRLSFPTPVTEWRLLVGTSVAGKPAKRGLLKQLYPGQMFFDHAPADGGAGNQVGLVSDLQLKTVQPDRHLRGFQGVIKA